MSALDEVIQFFDDERCIQGAVDSYQEFRDRARAELADLRARALPKEVVEAVRHCMSVANGPTVDRIDAMHALRHAIEADAKGEEK